MLKMMFKKIYRNKWLVSCLLIGLIFSMAIVSSIPMYSSGILHKLIKNDLEDYQNKYKIFPGIYVFNKRVMDQNEEDVTPASMGKWEDRPRNYEDIPSNNVKFGNIYHTVDSRISEELIPEIKLPLNTSIKILTAFKMVFKDQADGQIVNKNEFGRLDAIYNIEEHIKIIDGRMFSSNKTPDGEYEIIVPEEAMNSLKLAMGKAYYVYQPYNDYINPEKYFKVKIVGVYTIKDTKDPVWFDKWDLISERGFAMDYSLFEKGFFNNTHGFIVLNDMYWSFAFDYKEIFPKNIPSLISAIESQKKFKQAEPFFPAQDILNRYIGREKQVKTMMWLFEVPVLIILLIYIFMITNMMVEQDRDEIAVLRSRGAKKTNILSIYLLQSLLLGGISIIIGPPVGLYICSIIGAANGFLEFVNRAKLNIMLSPEAYWYSFFVLIIFLSIVSISIISGLKQSISERKQTKVRFRKKPLWQRFYLDVLLLIVCGYGYYNYTIRNGIVASLGSGIGFIPVDPVVYLVSSCFVLGMGMLLLRIYPFIIKGVFLIGKNKWSSVLYSSFTNVARSNGKNQFIMLFLILAVSFGIFNTKAGRTINTNVEENIRYLCGSDIIVKESWESNLDSMKMSERAKYRGPVIYKEPDFSRYSKIEGIEYATRVFRTGGFTVSGAHNVNNAYLMGITPEEFRYAAWLQNTPELYNQYLEILEANNDAVILSSDFAENQGFKLEDNIRISLDNGMYFYGYVAGFADYWPGFNIKETSNRHFVIANFDYLESNRILLPYEVWMKRNENVSKDKIYDSFKNNGLKIEKMIDENQELIRRKNDPVLQGTNGSLSLGFIAIMVITLAGFVIYWVMCIKRRVLQYGIIRSLGLSRKKIIEMIAWEQIFTSGAAVIIGTIIGEINSTLFLPIIQVTSRNNDQVLPFKIVITSTDYLKLYILLLIILLIGFIVLAINTYGFKIDQALKLGED